MGTEWGGIARFVALGAMIIRSLFDVALRLFAPCLKPTRDIRQLVHQMAWDNDPELDVLSGPAVANLQTKGFVELALFLFGGLGYVHVQHRQGVKQDRIADLVGRLGCAHPVKLVGERLTLPPQVRVFLPDAVAKRLLKIGIWFSTGYVAADALRKGLNQTVLAATDGSNGLLQRVTLF